MLDNVEFNAYIQKTIAFARTIVIKCEDLALLDNRLMEPYYGINSGTDQSNWRYYLLLNGEYHSTDEIMKVQSLDNGDVIDFTKANLDIHPATKRAYRLGSYYYTRLTEKYPAQSNLINGIINPIPPSESIPANNYQILRYNKDYVLWNEYQLIPALQEHINNMVLTSFKTEYLYTDNLMLTILLGNLYASLVSAILMIREEAEGTRYVHEFHIWSKLTSHGISPIYKSVLDNKQTMWLYRNIDWVLRKQGRIQTFDSLVDIILTHRNIPLARHEALQTTTDQLDNLVPTPAFISRPVNLQNRLGLSSRMLTVSELIVKENKVAIDNAQEESYSIATAEYNISTGVHSDIPTKVLESTMVDATDRNPNTIMRVLHNHWIYLAANGIYQINHDFVDFRSGTRFKLSTKVCTFLLIVSEAKVRHTNLRPASSCVSISSTSPAAAACFAICSESSAYPKSFLTASFTAKLVLKMIVLAGNTLFFSKNSSHCTLVPDPCSRVIHVTVSRSRRCIFLGLPIGPIKTSRSI